MAKQPTAGELRHTLELIHRTETGKDDHGQPIYSDAIIADDLLGKVQQLAGRDLEYARQLYHLATYRVQLRADSRLYVNAFLRIAGTGKVLGIGSVIELDERGVWSEVLCSEIDPAEVGLNPQPPGP